MADIFTKPVRVGTVWRLSNGLGLEDLEDEDC